MIGQIRVKKQGVVAFGLDGHAAAVGKLQNILELFPGGVILIDDLIVQNQFHAAGADPAGEIKLLYSGVDVTDGAAGVDHRNVTVFPQQADGFHHGIGNNLRFVIHNGTVNIKENDHIFLRFFSSSYHGFARLSMKDSGGICPAGEENGACGAVYTGYLRDFCYFGRFERLFSLSYVHLFLTFQLWDSKIECGMVYAAPVFG